MNQNVHTYIVVFVLVFLNSDAMCQRLQLLKFDYSKSDSIAINMPRSSVKTAGEFAKELTKNLNTEHEKYRAIFRWVCENVEYRKGRDLDEADDVYKKKKTEVRGFAIIVEAMCHAVGIKCETVAGFIKTNPYNHIPKAMKEPDHAWNAVFLAGEWHLSDASLGAGVVEPRRKKFYQQFREEWFLPDANFFIYTHYPEDVRWMLHDIEFKKNTFKKGPIYTINAYNASATLGAKTKGKIKRKLKLTIDSEKELEYATILFAGDEDQPYSVLLKRRDNIYTIDYSFDKDQSGLCTLQLNGEPYFLFIKP